MSADRDLKKKLKQRKQVAPENITEESELENNSSVMEAPGLDHVPSTSSMKFDTVAKVVHNVRKGSAAQINAFRMLSNVKQMGAKWKDYTTQRRLRRKAGVDPGKAAGLLGEEDPEQTKMSGIGLGEIHRDFVTPDVVKRHSSGRLNISMIINCNHALFTHFTKMANEPHERALIDLEFVEKQIANGADINTRDEHGQSLLHEVARAWHTDVAKWLLEHGCKVDNTDNYGRTALHVAAAVDCADMINVLIDWGADKEALTKTENHTPVFFAAKSDATNSLKALIKNGCKFKLIKDYKGRTPIHVAAELDRSETARLLLELKAPIGVCDNTGQKAISWMITKMAPVANEALKGFRTIERHHRKQYFYLNLLVQDRKLDPDGRSQTPLQVAVAYKQHELLLQPTMRRLQHFMWIRFGRFWAFWNLGINFLYILLWTLIGILVEYDERHTYNFPDDWYRVFLWIIAVAATAWQITEEVMEYVRSKRNNRNWEKWRTKSIDSDMEFCHPRWPEEKEYLDSELNGLEKLHPKYWSDAWNIFDWLCYILLLVDIVTHVADVASHSEAMARAHIRLMAITIILLWLRLMKNARAFTLLGPFIVILGHMLSDCARFLFLYMEFYLPFMAVFWMVYGGTKKSQSDSSQEVIVPGYQYPAQLIFSLFRLTLVDDYPYDDMKAIDEVFTDIILMSWFILSSILCLNLFIALLSDTFQRVYDNAQANAVMQKAITILNIWEGISNKRKEKFFKYIEDNCSPLVEYYDDDLTQDGEEDLKKVTFQIKDAVEDFTEQFKLHFGDIGTSKLLLGMDDKKEGTGAANKKLTSGGSMRGAGGRGLVTQEKFESEVEGLHEGLRSLQDRHDQFIDTYRQDMDTLQRLLKQAVQPGGGSTGESPGAGLGGTGPRPLEGSSYSSDMPPIESAGTHVKKMKRKKRKPNPMDMVLSVEHLEPTDGEFGAQHSPFSPSGLLKAFAVPSPVPSLPHLSDQQEFGSELTSPSTSSILQLTVDDDSTPAS